MLGLPFPACAGGTVGSVRQQTVSKAAQMHFTESASLKVHLPKTLTIYEAWTHVHNSPRGAIPRNGSRPGEHHRQLNRPHLEP